jgi:hypothetical protein
LILRTAGENNLEGRRQRIIRPELRRNLITLGRLRVKEHFILWRIMIEMVRIWC